MAERIRTPLAMRDLSLVSVPKNQELVSFSSDFMKITGREYLVRLLLQNLWAVNIPGLTVHVF